MGIKNSHLKLIELAMSGNTDALNQLAVEIHDSLHSYVLRVIFKTDITEDIVQETLLEMFKIFKQLKQADHFWPWLCKIALNKIRNHSQTQSRHQQLLKEHTGELTSKSPQLDGLATAINEEFKQCIFQAMSILSDRQKAVLSMRCYENMSYAQIAEVMGMSELGCRLLFIRARKKLQNKLFTLGYGQKSLLLALALFGKLTASSEAAAAQVCVTPAALSAGGLATGIAIVTSKTAVTLATAGIVVTGASVMTSHYLDTQNHEISSLTVPAAANINKSVESSSHINEGSFYFPQGKQGPVLSRLVIHNESGTIHVLQNDTGNYYYDISSQSATIENYHYWKPDLSVMTLPTDSSDLESFLAQKEYRKPVIHNIKSDAANLLVALSGDEENLTVSAGVKNYDALLEERFQYNWLARTKITDNRDALHQEGWCLFEMKGQVNGQSILGKGAFPFIYSKAQEKPAWLMVSIDGTLRLIDVPDGAVLINTEGKRVLSYQAGTLLGGLNTPWMGLHVIDTLRRDAAQNRISFAAKLNTDHTKGFVRLQLSHATVEYTVDMNKDLIEQIRFMDLSGSTLGELSFTYQNPSRSNMLLPEMPRLPLDTGSVKIENVHWLTALVSGQLMSVFEELR